MRSGHRTTQREGKVRVNFECSPDLWEKFRRVAESNGRTRSGQLRWLMAEAVDRQEKS